MKSFGIAALAAAALILGACGGTSHASCKDEKSTMEYAQKWATDLGTAMASGKVDAAKAQASVQKQAEEAGKMGNDFGAYCNMLDGMRKDLGF